MKMPSNVEYQLLCALGAREVSGRDLAKRYKQEQGTSLSYGTLYTSMRRLKEGGWVDVRDAKETNVGDEEEPDRRVRYFKLSAVGMAALPKLQQIQNTFALGEVAA